MNRLLKKIGSKASDLALKETLVIEAAETQHQPAAERWRSTSRCLVADKAARRVRAWESAGVLAQ